METRKAKLILEDGTQFTGWSFGHPAPAVGEVVFTTGMVGYPESLTDPSYAGQILVLTYPLVGNYGVPPDEPEGVVHSSFESERIHVSGLVVAEVCEEPSHWQSARSLDAWLKAERVPGIFGVDTRMLTKRLRERGTMLGKLVVGTGREPAFWDPNKENLVSQVSVRAPQQLGDGDKKVVLIDCGCKHGILRSLLARGVSVLRVPWDYDLSGQDFDGVVISNGPGDPKMARGTIFRLRRLLEGHKPILGICLGNQLLALAAGANTYKLKFGHRSQNQPCIEVGTKRCFITSQNHGYAVDTRTLPEGWEPWFVNANDGTNEGVRHRSKPFMGVQFHPEASPGPVDTAFLFDQFVSVL
ncbi:MAG: glutamine-hydrolyzing carbamoyl-phosphate synthase small subunit [candidate division KSB1 bacterium]|nr:glutamine-hydrolyzing carbamoyl-phosphate synthase small subunit [candidate division KSB1 bacterium]